MGEWITPKAPGAACHKCPLWKAPFVPPNVPKDAEYILLGEAPGQQEVIRKTPFIGPSGELLGGVLRKAGIDLSAQHKTNAVLCRPSGNRTPTDLEIECCSARLKQEIEESPAKRIAALGASAHTAIAKLAGTKPALSRWMRYRNREVLALRHPAYVLRNPNEALQWIRMLKKLSKGMLVHPVQTAPKVVLLTDVQAIRRVMDFIPDEQWVAFDVETDQVKWYDRPNKPRDRLLMFAFAFSYDTGYIVPEETLKQQVVKDYLTGWFARHQRTAAHNSKFDMTFLRSYGIHAKTGFDTILAHYCLNEEKMTHGLKLLATEYFDVHDYEHDLVKRYLTSREDKYSKIPFEPFSQYAAWDVVLTYALREELEKELIEENLLEKPFYLVLMPGVEAYTQVEMNGMKIDRLYLEGQAEMLYDELEMYTEQLRELSGIPDLNPNSSVRLAKVVYDDLKMPLCTRKNTSPRSTSKAAIADLILRLEEQGKELPQFMRVLRQYRRSQKILTSYVEPILDFADTNDRVHPRVSLFGTETGRIAVTDPAVHTIPRPNDKYGKMLRGSFIAEPGNVLLICDFSQAEFRYFAAVTKDPYLMGAYRSGRDLHTEVAGSLREAIMSLRRGVDTQIPDAEVRRIAKTWNFSNVYGESEKSSGKMHQIPASAAAELYRHFRGLMPKAIAWKASQFEKMRKYGFVISRLGRKRRFPVINESNQAEARKSSFNAPIQGAASDITMLAMIRLLNEGYKVIMTVHDSILIEVAKERAEEAKEYVKEVMREVANHYVPEVPWKADADYGPRWEKY